MENKKSRVFKVAFLRLINEDVTAASCGMGTHGDQFSADTYAPGDNRIPKVLGVRRVKGKKKSKFPIQRRPIVGM